MPLKGDEKTKVISVTPPVTNQPIGAKQVSPLSANKTPQPSLYSSYFKKGNSTARRTIIAGAIGGGLLVSFLALSSFKKKPEDEEFVSGGATDSTTAIPEDVVTRINTGHEVYTTVHDDLLLEDARSIAREHVGEDGLFMHNSELHLARTDEEWNNLAQDDKLQYINDINVTPPSADDVVILPVDLNGTITDLKMDPLHLGDLWQLGYDDSGHSFFIPQGREAIALDNISRGEDGIYYRTDPISGEMKVFSVEEVIQQIDQKGSVELEVLVPGFEEPVIESEILVEPDTVTTDMMLTEYKSDYDLAMEAAIERARESGIDNINKVKVHQDRHGNWDFKAKGDDGEKLKGSLTIEELHTDHTETAVVGEVIEDNSGDNNLTSDTVVTGELINDKNTINSDDHLVQPSHDFQIHHDASNYADQNDTLTTDTSSDDAIYNSTNPEI